MMRNSRLRRVIAVVLLVAGMALMLLSAEVGAGLLTFGLGVALELIGLLLERRGRRSPSKEAPGSARGVVADQRMLPSGPLDRDGMA
jgi:hypothetical protein